MADPFAQFVGNALDNVGTWLNLPELGISEGQAGGATTNTGRVKSANGSPVIDAAYAAKHPNVAGNYSQLDNNPLPNNDSSAGGGGGSAGYNPADLAYIDDQTAQLNRQKQSAQNALNNGITQLGDSYNQQLNATNLDRSRALEDFDLKTQDTTRQKDQALGRVDMNSRTLANSLRNRIGLASGANSSAYQQTAPGAVAREASTQRTGVQENYGQNFRDLGLAQDRAKTDFDTALQDLLSQKNQRESDFRGGILDRENQIDQSLAEAARQRALLLGGGYNQVKTAMAPFSGAISQRQSDIDNLFNQYRTPFNVQPVNVQTPQLRDYVTNNSQIAANSPTSQSDPFSDLLKKKLEETPLA